MSMWVYNRVICKKETKDMITNRDYFESKNLSLCCFHLLENKIENDLYELRFETHSSDYRDEEIRHVIEKYHEVKWYCTEEEIYEQGYYYWDKEVQLKVKPVCYGNARDYVCMYINYDDGLYIWWPKYSIAFYTDSEEYNLIIDDFDNFKTYKYDLDDVDLKELLSIVNNRNYIGNDNYILLAKKGDDNCDDLHIDSILGELRIESEDSKTIKENKYDELKYFKNHNIAYEIRDHLNKIIKKYNSNYEIKISTCKELE